MEFQRICRQKRGRFWLFTFSQAVYTYFVYEKLAYKKPGIRGSKHLKNLLLQLLLVSNILKFTMYQITLIHNFTAFSQSSKPCNLFQFVILLDIQYARTVLYTRQCYNFQSTRFEGSKFNFINIRKLVKRKTTTLTFLLFTRLF